MDIKDIEQILSVLKQHEVTEFELSKGDVHIKLSRERLAGQGASQVVHAVAVQPAIVGAPGAAPAAVVTHGQASAQNGVGGGAAIPGSWLKVESPIVGTFYRRPSPDKEAFVREGQRVEKGDTLCIIEAMKLMNEIDAPHAGKIEKVCLNDGQVVEYGEVLFYINPDA